MLLFLAIIFVCLKIVFDGLFSIGSSFISTVAVVVAQAAVVVAVFVKLRLN